jgi:hypothetical protein
MVSIFFQNTIRERVESDLIVYHVVLYSRVLNSASYLGKEVEWR